MSIVLSSTVTIDASPAQVWAVLTDFPASGEWSNFDRGDGTTQVDNVETSSGAMVRPFTRFFARSHGDNGYTAFNRALKERVEGRRTV